MRTKVLALSALVGALGAASAIAQTNVYSINAVGYINVTLSPGFNILTCQLVTTNNTVANLLNDSSGVYDGCTVYKFTPAHPGYNDDFGDSTGSSYSNGWDFNGTITMNPGEAIWFNNGKTTNLTATFVGTVPQGTNIVPIIQGYQMIGSPVPFSGDLVTNMQFTNYADHSTLYVFNNPAPGKPRGAYNINFIDLTGGASSSYKSQWDGPDPELAVGQGFFYDSGVLNAPGALGPDQQQWIQVFSINP
jgi:hypothetical protein